MPLSRLSRHACLALAVLLTVTAVNLTVPGVFVRAAAESQPDTDDDRELELAASNCPSRPTPSADRATGRFARLPRHRGASNLASPRTICDARSHSSTDPLGSRLRC